MHTWFYVSWWMSIESISASFESLSLTLSLSLCMCISNSQITIHGDAVFRLNERKAHDQSCNCTEEWTFIIFFVINCMIQQKQKIELEESHWTGNNERAAIASPIYIHSSETSNKSSPFYGMQHQYNSK